MFTPLIWTYRRSVLNLHAPRDMLVVRAQWFEFILLLTNLSTKNIVKHFWAFNALFESIVQNMQSLLYFIIVIFNKICAYHTFFANEHRWVASIWVRLKIGSTFHERNHTGGVKCRAFSVRNEYTAIDTAFVTWPLTDNMQNSFFLATNSQV